MTIKFTQHNPVYTGSEKKEGSEDEEIEGRAIDPTFYMQLFVHDLLTTISTEKLVGLQVASARECEASVLRSIHSSSTLEGALRRPTTCSDPVGIMGDVLFTSLRFGICEAARSSDQGA